MAVVTEERQVGWGKALRWELMKHGYFLKFMEECTDSGRY